jgi:DNA mismatch repair protein MutL
VLTRAVLDGYETLLMRGRYPICVVFLQIAPGEVDVNVHPAKAEVRFRDAGAMHRIIARGIATRLREAMAGTPPRDSGERATPPSYLPRNEWRRSGSGRSWMGVGESPGALGRAHEAPNAYATSAVPSGAAGVAESAAAAAGAPEISAPTVPAAGGFAALRFLGQVLDGYLVCEGRDGLVIIDQHAAHERVRFERLRAQTAAGVVPAQRLLVPDTLQLGLRDVQALVEAAPLLERLGFEGEAFGGGTYVLRAVPTLLADTDCPAVLRDLAADLAELGASRAGHEAMDGILARIACHSAVRVGRRLERAEVEALLRAMDEVDRSAYCPHGRPAFLAFARGTLERMFKRQ